MKNLFIFIFCMLCNLSLFCPNIYAKTSFQHLIKGKATIIIDGVKHVFIFNPHFLANTTFTEPKESSIEFMRKLVKNEIANPSRIIIRTEAFRKGNYSTSNHNTQISYIAEGGQLFSPQKSCTIEITKPYTNSNTSLYQGQIKNCIVASNGIQHTLSLDFTLKGKMN